MPSGSKVLKSNSATNLSAASRYKVVRRRLVRADWPQQEKQESRPASYGNPCQGPPSAPPYPYPSQASGAERLWDVSGADPEPSTKSTLWLSLCQDPADSQGSQDHSGCHPGNRGSGAIRQHFPGACWISSPCGLQPFEAQPDHWCPTEHATQIQGLHAFGHVERHTGQNVLWERECIRQGHVLFQPLFWS